MSHDLAKAAPPAPGHATTHTRRSWTVATIVAVLMVVLVLVGVGLTTTSTTSTARAYWVSLVPVFGLLCVGTAWLRSAPDRPFDRRAVLRQVFHWLGIAVALWIDFFILSIGEETRVATGMNAVLVLALGCYLAGVHLELLFVLVGLLLTLTLTVVGKIDQYQWLIFVVGAALVALMLALRWLLVGRHVHLQASVAAPPSTPAGS